MKEFIQIAVETVNDETKSAYRFAFPQFMRDLPLKRALLHMSANKVSAGDAVAVLDLTLTKNGEEGCLFSGDSLYFTRLLKPVDLRCTVKAEGVKKTLTVTYDDGTTVKVRIGKAASYISEVINETVRLKNGGVRREKKQPPKPDEVVVVKSNNNPFSFKL